MSAGGDQSAMLELKQKELVISQQLMSGLENFNPNLNMFGSNVFTSIESRDRDGGFDAAGLVNNSAEMMMNLMLNNDKNRGDFTLGLNESSINNQRLSPPNPFVEEKVSTSKLTSVNTRSKQRLEKLKHDYNGGIIDDMFPVK